MPQFYWAGEKKPTEETIVLTLKSPWTTAQGVRRVTVRPGESDVAALRSAGFQTVSQDALLAKATRGARREAGGRAGLAEAAKTTYHQLGGLNNKHSFLTVLEDSGGSPESGHLHGQVLGEGPLSGLLHPHMAEK